MKKKSKAKIASSVNDIIFSEIDLKELHLIIIKINMLFIIH